MMTGPPGRFVRSADVKLKQVGASTAAYVRDRKALHVLNPTARLLIEYLEEPAGFDELVLMLGEATDGSQEEIAGDLARALDGLLEQSILERVE